MRFLDSPNDGSWAKARRRLSSNLKPWMEGRIPGGVPATIIRSVVEDLYRPEIRRHVRSIQTELPPRIMHFALDPDLPEWFRREKALDSVHTYDVVDVVVSPSTGLVWLDDESLAFQESVGSLPRMTGWGNSLWETNRRPVPGPRHAVVLPWTGYFHFLLESLPSFIRSLRVADASAAVVVPEQRPAIVDEVLGHLGIAGERVFSATRPLRLRHCVFTGISPYSGFVDSCDIQSLRSSIANHVAPVSPNRQDVYVSRKNTPRRALNNEGELEEALTAIGFKTVYAEQLSLREQIEVFRQARCVVAPHGAGLANLVWCDKPSGVIEIFAHGMHNDCYARLAVSMGSRYRPISCDPYPSSAGQINIRAVLQAAMLESEKPTCPGDGATG